MNKKVTEEVIVYSVNPMEIKVSGMASNTPEMDKADYEAVFLDIKENGQLNPVLVYRGKIVDGRHRRKICMELGLQLKCKDLPYKLTIKKLEDILNSMETRKNKTRGQKAIMAYRYALHNNISQKDAAARHGISPQEISMIKSILTYQDGEKIIDTLFSGKAAEIRIVDGSRVYSKHLPTLLTALKTKNSKQSDSVGNHELALLLEQSRINDRSCVAPLETLLACHEMRIKELKELMTKSQINDSDCLYSTIQNKEKM